MYMTDDEKRVKRITSEEINILFALLYKLDDHCEVYLKNDTTAQNVIQILNKRGFKQ